MTTQERIYRINEIAGILSRHVRHMPADAYKALQDSLDKLTAGLPDAVNDD